MRIQPAQIMRSGTGRSSNTSAPSPFPFSVLVSASPDVVVDDVEGEMVCAVDGLSMRFARSASYDSLAFSGDSGCDFL